VECLFFTIKAFDPHLFAGIGTHRVLQVSLSGYSQAIGTFRVLKESGHAELCLVEAFLCHVFLDFIIGFEGGFKLISGVHIPELVLIEDGQHLMV
jgi:hypothetical protein